MKYCAHCGKQVVEEAVVCIHCGCPVGSTNGGNQTSGVVDTPNAGLNLLAFFIPLVGLILFCATHSQTPKKANQIGSFALIGFIINCTIFMILAMSNY